MASLIGLLSSLTLFGIIQSQTITFKNNCNYKVWVAEEEHVLANSKNVESNSSWVTEPKTKGRIADFLLRTGCLVPGIYCNSGDELSPCPCLGCCLETPIEIKVLFSFNYEDRDDYYFVSVIYGYNIPVQISPKGEGSDKCNRLLCNATLDQCPSNETNGFGDLRVMKGNTTVGCVSPCTKRNFPPPTGQPNSKYCNSMDYPGLKYLDMMNRKCPGGHQYDNGEQPLPYNKLSDLVYPIYTACKQGMNYEVDLCP